MQSSFILKGCRSANSGTEGNNRKKENVIEDKTKVMLRLHWTTFSPRPYHVLKIQERGEDGVKMKQFRISKFPTTSLLRPRHVLITSAPRPYYVLHVSTTSSIRAHQVHPVSTTPLLRPHEDQAVHTTRELRFQHVLTVNN